VNRLRAKRVEPDMKPPKVDSCAMSRKACWHGWEQTRLAGTLGKGAVKNRKVRTCNITVNVTGKLKRRIRLERRKAIVPVQIGQDR